VLFASFVDARDFVERFEPPIVPIASQAMRDLRLGPRFGKRFSLSCCHVQRL
jgi:hypothetical protein